MYNFHDTAEIPKPHDDLPAEALCFGGAYIENMVPGYRTLYTAGREGGEREISQTESSDRDGARFRSVRRKPREIRVGFQINSKNARDYVGKFNALKKLLQQEERQMIFHDEPDKFYTGTLTDIAVEETGDLCVTGELVFVCSDPYKYAVEERAVTAPATNGRAVIEVYYNGTVDAYPVLRTTTRANTESLLYSDDAGNMVAVGTPDAGNAGLSRGTRNLTANANSLLNSSIYPQQVTRYAEEYYRMTPVRVNDGTQEIVTINGTRYLSMTRITPSGGGQAEDADTEEEEVIDPTVDTSEVTGITLYKAITETSMHNYVVSLQPLFYADDLREVGYFHFGLMFDIVEQSDTLTAEIEEAEIILEKTGIGSAYATAIMCIYGVEQKRVRVRVGKDNPISGLNGVGMSIARFGDIYTFGLGEETYEIDASGMASLYKGQNPRYICVSLARVKGQQQLAGLGISSAQSVSTGRGSVDELATVMRASELIVVDCSTGEIRTNGRPTPALGSIDNNWTEFALKPGFNRIECTAVTSEEMGAKPTSYTMTYREVWE